MKTHPSFLKDFHRIYLKDWKTSHWLRRREQCSWVLAPFLHAHCSQKGCLDQPRNTMVGSLTCVSGYIAYHDAGRVWIFHDLLTLFLVTQSTVTNVPLFLLFELQFQLIDFL